MNTRILAAALAAATAMLASPAIAQDQDANPTGDAGDQAASRDSGQPVEDTWITTKVKSALLVDEDAPGTRIEVDTVDGVVTLSGSVDTQAEADQAVAAARGIEGVKRVDSKLTVSGAGE